MYNMRRYWPISPAVRVVMTDPQLDDDIIATCINKNKQNNYYCISFYRVCLKKTLQKMTFVLGERQNSTWKVTTVIKMKK